MTRVFLVVFVCLVSKCLNTQGRFLVVPEDVAMLFTTIDGFAPPTTRGNDHRIGFGYRFGNHADVQILYELGPQLTTKKLQSINVPKSTALSRRFKKGAYLVCNERDKGCILKNISYNVRSLPLSDRKSRRPLLDLLVRTGLVKEASYDYGIVHDKPK